MPGHGLTAELLSPAPAEAVAVIYTQMAHAVGLAMQNIVSQQQTLNTINNAIATKALNMLADKDPAAALAEIRKQFESATASTVSALGGLAGIPQGSPPAGGGGAGGGSNGGGGNGGGGNGGSGNGRAGAAANTTANPAANTMANTAANTTANTTANPLGLGGVPPNTGALGTGLSGNGSGWTLGQGGNASGGFIGHGNS
jgi:hypothetical protein